MLSTMVSKGLPGEVHVIDLTPGDGARLAGVATDLGIPIDRRWGLAENGRDLELAAARVGNVLLASHDAVAIRHGGASLALCSMDSDQQVYDAADSLVTGGVIAIHIGLQKSQLPLTMIRYLSQTFTSLYQIKGVGVMGIKRDGVSINHSSFRLDSIEPATMQGRYRLPPSTGFSTRWMRLRPSEEEVQIALAEVMRGIPVRSITLSAPKPVMPLSPGHLGMALASGILDGLIQLESGRQVVVKGVSSKEQFEVVSESSESQEGGTTTRKTVYSERGILKIRTIDEDGVIVEYAGE